MSDTEGMTIGERLKYLRLMQERYRRASRAEKSKLLVHMMEVTRYSRKHLISLLGGSLQRRPRPGYEDRRMDQRWLRRCASSTRHWTTSVPSV
jgi:hypothetical protein